MLSKKKSKKRLATPRLPVLSAAPRQHVMHATPYTLSKKAGSMKRRSAGADETPACEGELAEGEHEARARVADTYALVDEVVHRERGDAHLRAAAHARII
jgi:hypothetical protein